MSEWCKITWGDISTMPEDGRMIEAHRKFEGPKNDDGSRSVVCWRMVGESRWHVPLHAPAENMFSPGHPIPMQVSLVHADYSGQCDDPLCGESLPHDEQFGFILDTLWWRPL